MLSFIKNEELIHHGRVPTNAGSRPPTPGRVHPVRHSADLPEGYRTRAQGRSCRRPGPAASRAAPGRRAVGTAPGRLDAKRAPVRFGGANPEQTTYEQPLRAATREQERAGQLVPRRHYTCLRDLRGQYKIVKGKDRCPARLKMIESAEAAITVDSVGDSPLRSTHHEVSDELSDNHHARGRTLVDASTGRHRSRPPVTAAPGLLRNEQVGRAATDLADLIGCSRLTCTD
jgi:hypothetical protein